MRGHRRFVAMLAAGMLTVAAGAARAHPPGGRFPMGGGPMMGDGPGSLPLPVLVGVMTDDQRAQLHKLMGGQRDAMHNLRTQLDAAYQDLSQKLLSPSTKKVDDVRPQIDRIGQLRQQMMEQGLTAMLQVRALLTPEQLAQAQKNLTQLESLHAQMRTLLGPMPAPPPE